MFGEIDRVKERRRERIEKIRLQSRDSLPPYFYEVHDPIEETYRPGSFPGRYKEGEHQPPGRSTQEVLAIQTVGALLVLGIAYLLFQTSLPFPASWKDMARQVMTRDFNFEGVAVWYESRFGSPPSVLPALHTGQRDVPAASNGEVSSWQMPKEWKLVEPYSAERSRVVIDMGTNDQVANKETGWVKYVGEMTGFGLTVVVQLSDQREAWYGNIDQPLVAKNDWVKPGDVLGSVRKQEGGSGHFLYLGLKEKERFLDPMEVIEFE